MAVMVDCLFIPVTTVTKTVETALSAGYKYKRISRH